MPIGIVCRKLNTEALFPVSVHFDEVSSRQRRDCVLQSNYGTSVSHILLLRLESNHHIVLMELWGQLNLINISVN